MQQNVQQLRLDSRDGTLFTSTVKEKPMKDILLSALAITIIASPALIAVALVVLAERSDGSPRFVIREGRVRRSAQRN